MQKLAIWQASVPGARTDWVFEKPRGHTGVDRKCAAGTPVRAMADGRVKSTGSEVVMGYGKYAQHVTLSLPGGIEQFTAHLARVTVRPGRRVKRNQVIGYSSNLYPHETLARSPLARDRLIDPIEWIAHNNAKAIAERRKRVRRIYLKYTGLPMLPVHRDLWVRRIMYQDVSWIEYQRRVRRSFAARAYRALFNAPQPVRDLPTV